ncbi:MAG: glycosyltransferase family 4 protein [Conexivisphaerales archaeon]
MRNEAESLVGAGYDVTVLSWDRMGDQPHGRVVNGVKVVSLKLARGSEFSKVSYAFSALLLQLYCVYWVLRNVRGACIVHANDFNTLSAGALLKVIRAGRLKLVYDCHELTPSAYSEWYGPMVGSFSASLERNLLRRADWVLTVSPPIRGYLAAYSKAPVTVIYNTIRASSVPEQEKSWWKSQLHLDGFVVSYVGMLRQDVCLDLLVEAARSVKRLGLDIRFVIVGYGPDMDRIRALASGLEGYVKFVPRVPHSVALGYVRASDISYAVYGNSARHTRQVADGIALADLNTMVAMPWKVFEAMACGTSVMVMGGTYTWRFVEELGFGLAVKAEDSSEIVEQLRWALENREELGLAAEAARGHFFKDFNWEAMSVHLSAAYDQLSRTC